jgi:type II secretory ATPase GspE/PulE/Tfp pilus assembly ATPase PilB-like protein
MSTAVPTILEQSEHLGDVLLEKHIIDLTELDYVRQKQAAGGGLLHAVLVQEGLLSELDVTRELSLLQGLEFIDVSLLDPPSEQLLSMFSREMCLTSRFLPLRREEQSLVVLLGDSQPQEVAQIVMRKTGMRCKFVRGQFSEVMRFIRFCYYFSRNPPEVDVKKEVARLAADAEHAHSPQQLVDSLMHWAVRERATDIHLTSSGRGYHILFRIDGVLQPMLGLPPALGRIGGYIKLRAEMDIAEQRRPQDGSFRTAVFDVPIAVRVSTIVTEHGERFVLRLLPEAHDIAGLASLGFFQEDVTAIARVMESPVGLVIITGPTGSGKSSTLHAGLRMQHLIERNVLTVEDPLEYRVPAAGQTEVNRKAGYDFGIALRHFLRHDPDVILVGEMRDAETAQAAFDAAATGHLVLSTLHVTTVFGVVPRLRPMGISPQVIAENLKLVINQRLVRKLCTVCAQPAAYTPQECDWLGVPHGTQGLQARGCPRCRNTGYFGRLPLYEILHVDHQMANAIADDVGREAIRTLAQAQGFSPMVNISRQRVLLGQTTIPEVYRVTGEGPLP